MIYRILADITMFAHFAFILFVLFGGLLAFWWPRIVWVHIPAAIWGGAVMLFGWTCPLTPIERHLRIQSGAEGYDTSFIEHYIAPILYPPGLTREIQIALGVGAVVVVVGIYGWYWYVRRQERSKARSN